MILDLNGTQPRKMVAIVRRRVRKMKAKMKLSKKRSEIWLCAFEAESNYIMSSSLKPSLILCCPVNLIHRDLDSIPFKEIISHEKYARGLFYLKT